MRLSYPPGGGVLVVAPHPDDDAIGCGGTLAKLAASGVRIGVTYVTDGSASHVKSERFPPAVLRDVREIEAGAALRRLGVRRRPQFLRAPDGRLGHLNAEERERIIAALARRIDALGARVVFAPWLRDPHPDHVATATLVGDALRACESRPQLYYYRVWEPVRAEAGDVPLPGEVIACEIALTTAELRRKRAAIMEHRSQLGLVVDDDPEGFCIDADLLTAWLAPVERFYRPIRSRTGTITA